MVADCGWVNMRVYNVLLVDQSLPVLPLNVGRVVFDHLLFIFSIPPSVPEILAIEV